MPDAFWNLSLDEIQDILEIHGSKIENRQKQDILNADFLARRIAEYMGPYLNDKNKVQSVYRYFPELFAKEIEESQRDKTNTELEINKARMRAFMEYHNEKGR